MHNEADHALLASLIAIERGWMTQQQWAGAVKAWSQLPSRSLWDTFVAGGVLTSEQCRELSSLKLQQESGANESGSSHDTPSTLLPAADSQLSTLPPQGIDSLSTVNLAKTPPHRSTPTLSINERDHSVRAGATNSRYHVMRFHAKGGLGTVSIARDQELNREVALKEIQSEFADDTTSRAKFVLEAEVTGGLEHPGIVPVYGLGCYADGRPYYAMRFIRGTSFADAIDKFHMESKSDGLTSPQRTIQLRGLLQRFIAVCQAIHYAHSRGVIHRDIKPGNVMLGDYGETLVVDWGLAKTIDSVTSDDGASQGIQEAEKLKPLSARSVAPTRFGSALGTLQFMSPEQAAGRSDQMGPAADIYSLGATLYYLLTGQPSVTGRTIGELLQAIQSGNIASPRAVRRDVPVALAAICKKAMSFQIADRYSSAKGLSEDLERWLADEPVIAHQDTISERAARWLRHNRTWFRAVVIATLLIIAILGASVFLVDNQRQIAEVQRGRAQALAVERTELATREADLRKKAEWQATNRSFEQSLFLCEQVDRTTGILALVTNLQEAEEIQATDLVKSIRAQIGQWQGAIHTLEEVIPLESSIRWIQSNPAKTHLLVGTNGPTYMLDFKTGKKYGQPITLDSRMVAAVFHPTEPTFATVGEDSLVRFWDTETLEPKGAPVRVEGVVTTMTLSPDARHWLMVVDRSIQFWDWDERKPTGLTLEHPQPVSDIEFCGSSNAMVSGDWDGNVRHWNLEASPPSYETWKHDSAVLDLAVSPDAKFVATCELGKSARVWEVETGRTVGFPLVHHAMVGHVTFDASGKRIITGCVDQSARIWDIQTSTLVGSPLRHPLIVNAAVFDFDGQFVWTGCGDNALRRWHIADSRSTPLSIGINSNVIATGFLEEPRGVQLLAGAIPEFVLPGEWLRWKLGSMNPTTLEPIDSISNAEWSQVATFSHNGRLLAAGDGSSGVGIWDRNTSDSISPDITLESELKTLIFSPDDTRLLIGTHGGEAIVIDVASGKAIGEPIRVGSRLSTGAFSPDNQRLLLGNWDQTVNVLEFRSAGYQTVAELKQESLVMCVGMNREGTQFFTSNFDGGIRIWDSQTLNQVGVAMQHESRTPHVVWSPDGSRISAGYYDGSVRVWDVRSGGMIGPPLWHEKEVMAIGQSADGTQLLSASSDGAVKHWNVAPATGTYQEIERRLQQLTGVTRENDGSLRPLSLDAWLERAANATDTTQQ